MKIRSRVRVLYWAPVVFLVLSGFFLDRRATAVRVVELERKVELVEKSISELRDSVENAKRLPSATLSDDSLQPRSLGRELSVYDEVPRPRFLGTGRSRSFFYADVRFPSGAEFRYYVPTNASRARVSRWVRGLAEDARLDAERCFNENRSPVGDW